MPNLVGSSTVYKMPNASAVQTPSFLHTVPVGTDLLFLHLGFQQSKELAIQPSFAGVNFEPVARINYPPTGASSDTRIDVWVIRNPIPGIGQISWRWVSSASNSAWATVDNWANVAIGTNLSDSITLIDSLQNSSPTFITGPMSGVGSSPDILILGAGFVGADGTPATNDAGFAIIHNDDTGGVSGNTNDHSFYVAQKEQVGAFSVTVTWAQTDENVGVITELKAATAPSAPVLTNQSDTVTSTTTGTGSVDTNNTTGTLYGVVTQSQITPTHAQIAAGQDHTGAAADATANVAPPLNGQNDLLFTGLSPATSYWTHFSQVSVDSQESIPVSTGGFITNSIPVLSAPIDLATGTSTSSASVDSNTPNGTVYAVVTQFSNTPSAAQIIAGQDHTGAPADSVNSVGGISGTNNFTFNGLVVGTAYFTHFTHQDIGGSDSVPISASGFTTNVTNQAPVVDAPISSQVCTIGIPYGPVDVSINFSDPDNDPLVFTATGLPNGLSISSAGVISGIPTGGFS